MYPDTISHGDIVAKGTDGTPNQSDNVDLYVVVLWDLLLGATWGYGTLACSSLYRNTRKPAMKTALLNTKREACYDSCMLSSLPLFSCILHFDLVSILFGTSIPTSFNILVKMFLHFIIHDV